MARITIGDNDFELFILKDPWISTDWEVYEKLDSNGNPVNKLFESLDDREHLREISATLRNPDGTYYDPIKGSVARVRVKIGDTKTDWLYKRCTKESERFPYTLPYPVPGGAKQ